MRHCTFLTTRQYMFLDKLNMRQYAFLQCNYTLLSSSYVIACTSTCGFAVKVRTIVQYGLWSVCAIVRY